MLTVNETPTETCLGNDGTGGGGFDHDGGLDEIVEEDHDSDNFLEVNEKTDLVDIIGGN